MGIVVNIIQYTYASVRIAEEEVFEDFLVLSERFKT